jgi:beta-mannosidase
MYRIDLNKDWKLRSEELYWGPSFSALVLEKGEGWLSTNLPCDVHVPLIENNIIKEPLVARNCYESEWIEDKSWWFKKDFNIDNEVLKSDVVELTLESLDAEADVFLNNVHLGHHRSAHYPFVKDIKEIAKTGENTLLVRVTSGLEHYSEMDIAALKNYVSTETDGNRGARGDKRRVFVRKPQYVYGWDWGPRVATCGIMRGVKIEAYSKLVIRSVHCITEGTGIDVEVEFLLEVESLHPYSSMEGIIKLELLYDGVSALSLNEEVFLRSGINFFELKGVVKNAKFWWPNGMGEQPLYTVKASAEAEEVVHEYPEFKYGLRTIRLNQDKIDRYERLFAVEVNGVKVFCKGGNWIPADSIYARVTDEKYETLISEAKNANFNMLRIWGGGIYEKDIFYEKCDEYGILLWHDFMFACALYPDNLDYFIEEVRKEINYQTRRLRNHSSIALWCGNNENHWGFESWWVGKKTPSFLGGAVCYNNLIPSIVRENCADIPYWNSSPYGGKGPNDNNAGDRHHWGDCTMNPDMERRITPEEYDKVSAKFVSEYGYIGPCRKSSIEKYHGVAPLDKNGLIWQLHNNTFEKETVPAGIAKHYTDPKKLNIDEYLLYAGLTQGLMYSYSLEAIHFKENCYGSLFWMYDDCWGEVGWTIIDYYLKRKISYYYVKRAFANVKFIIREQEGKLKIMGINETKSPLSLSVEYGYTSFDSKSKTAQNAELTLAPYSRQIVLELEKGDFDISTGCYYIRPICECSCVLPAIFTKTSFKDLNTPKANLTISNFVLNGRDARFTVASNLFAHAVHFNLDDSLRLSDEYFDLLPGESREVTVYNVISDFNADCINAQYI